MAYTNIDDPSAYFQVALHSSAGSATITNDGNSDLQPDLIWSKARGAAYNHGLYDSSRGVTKFLSSNATSAETTASSGFDLTSFNTDGFSTGNNQYNTICGGTTYVGWQWKANGGTTATNSNGNRDTTVQANTDAGFSIVTYLSNGSAANQTLGHGLGVAPDVIISKRRGATTDWLVYHKSLGVGSFVLLNSDNPVSTSSPPYKDDPTSTVFSTQNQFQATDNFVSYCFAEKQGFSKFGKYYGNGNANGPFVYTGFKPAWLMIKPYTNSGYNWVIMDSTRNPFNPIDKYIWADLDGAEYDGTGIGLDVDFLSNGFKLSTSRGEVNLNGATMLFMAFAENPFVTSTGIPTTAR